MGTHTHTQLAHASKPFGFLAPGMFSDLCIQPIERLAHRRNTSRYTHSLHGVVNALNYGMHGENNKPTADSAAFAWDSA